MERAARAFADRYDAHAQEQLERQPQGIEAGPEVRGGSWDNDLVADEGVRHAVRLSATVRTGAVA